MLKELYFWSTLRSVGVVLVAAVAVSGALIAISHTRGFDRSGLVKRLEWVWLAASISAVAILTLQPGPDGFGSTLPALFNPLSGFSPRDAAANLALYVPVGFFAALTWRESGRPIVWATILAFGVSVSIEFAQLTLPIGRAAQVHDVVFNTLGGVVGGVMGVLVVGWVRQSNASMRHESSTRE